MENYCSTKVHNGLVDRAMRCDDVEDSVMDMLKASKRAEL
jgi:hypothetical protein